LQCTSCHSAECNRSADDIFDARHAMVGRFHGGGRARRELRVAEAMIEPWQAPGLARVVSLFAEDGVLQIAPLPQYSGRDKRHLDRIPSGIERLDFNAKPLHAFGVDRIHRAGRSVRTAACTRCWSARDRRRPCQTVARIMDLATMGKAIGG